MDIAVVINTCDDCRYRDHSGAYTPGGAKPICGHDKACVKRKATFDKYHWKQRVIEDLNKIPNWCPLKHGASY